jgi:hypothetical protein
MSSGLEILTSLGNRIYNSVTILEQKFDQRFTFRTPVRPNLVRPSREGYNPQPSRFPWTLRNQTVRPRNRFRRFRR